jgi:alcohol dehydrogenase class IV
MDEIIGSWNYPTKIIFGLGKSLELCLLCDQMKLSNPIIVSDNNVMTIDSIKLLVSTIKTATVFLDVDSNPTGLNVENASKIIQSNNHDGVIAIGGGSVIDVAKTIALVAYQSRPWIDFEDQGDNYLLADDSIILPIIAIPTTSGTGSEVGRASLIVDESIPCKRVIFHPKMLPVAVICDPLLTIGVSERLTAATGMDALAHNLEALCAKGFHPMADGIALEALRIIKNYLHLAYKDGNNLEARSYMMVSALMGGTSFQKGLGCIHSLSHPVGAIYDLHHGLLNAIFMPYVLNYNRNYIEDKMVRLARILDLDEHSVSSVIEWLIELNKLLGIPKSLSVLGIREDDGNLDKVIIQAMEDGSTISNPRPMDYKSVKELYVNVIRGDL